MFGALGLIGFLVAIVMYFVWRLWVEMRGVEWKPRGHWEARTTASDGYLATFPPVSRRRRVFAGIVVVVVIVGVICLPDVGARPSGTRRAGPAHKPNRDAWLPPERHVEHRGAANDHPRPSRSELLREEGQHQLDQLSHPPSSIRGQSLTPAVPSPLFVDRLSTDGR